MFHCAIQSNPNPVVLPKYLIQSGLSRENSSDQTSDCSDQQSLAIHIRSGWVFFEIQSDSIPVINCRIRLDRDPATGSCSTLMQNIALGMFEKKKLKNALKKSSMFRKILKMHWCDRVIFVRFTRFQVRFTRFQVRVESKSSKIFRVDSQLVRVYSELSDKNCRATPSHWFPSSNQSRVKWNFTILRCFFYCEMVLDKLENGAQQTKKWRPIS